MYSERKVEEKCYRFKERYGWALTPHSPDEVDRFNAGLKKLEKVDSKGASYFDDSLLTPAMYRFIQNERALAALSAEYFLTRYFWLTETDIQHFSFRSGQKTFFSVLQQLEDLGVSQDIQCLKARKQGISTLVEGLMTHSSLMVPGTRCSIGSADDQKTQVMMEMMYGALGMIPWWLTPTQTRDKRSGRALLQFSHIGTMIVIQHGAMRGGIGQGTTPNKIHLCLSGNTLVRTEDSGTIPIREMKAGMKVLSASGSMVDVRRHWKSPRRNELTSEIQVWGSPTPLSCTRDHKILLDRGWVEAKDVKEGDNIVYPLRKIENTKSIQWLAIDKYKHRKHDRNCQMEAVAPSFELGRIIGLYLAEGCIFRGQFRLKDGTEKRRISGVTMCLDCDETDEVRQWLDETGLGDWTNKTLHRKTSRTSTMHIRHRGLAEWLIENFGEKDSKHVSDLCWKMGKDFAEGVVWGYLFGDGHFPTYNAVAAPSIRAAIPFGIRELIASLGYGWSQITWRPAGFWYNRNCQAQWTLQLAGTTAAAYRKARGFPSIDCKEDSHWNFDSGRLLLEVSGNNEGYSEDFYDIEVDDITHAFTTACGVVHNSEVSQFTNPEAQIEEGLFKAVPTTPDTLMVLESTGEGNTGWWADQWRANKEKYWQGRARMLPLFLPWFMTPELYPTRNWIQKFPFPAGWKRGQSNDVHTMIEKCELYVKSTEVLSRILGKDWRLPDEQVWYWQFHFEDAKLRRMEKSWARQMPCDDFEALIGEHDSVYGMDTIIECHKKREKTIEAYGIIGSGVNERHDPPPALVDYSKSRIAIDWKTPNGVPVEWILMPLTGNPESDKYDPLKKLIVYEKPQKGSRYSIGVDPGTGVGGDRTAICVLKTGYDAFPDVQVAEFASDDIGNTEIFAWVAAIAAWYGQFYEEDATVRIIIEQKRKYGDSCYHALKLHGFKNHHKFRMYDKKTLRERASVNPREGWFTNEWSRPMLLDAYKNACNNGWFKVNSKWLLAEMEGHEQRVTEGGKTRADHARGKHDDRLFAAAMAYFTHHDLDIMIEREHKRCQAPSGDVEWEVDESPWMGPAVENIEAERFIELYGESA